jgi:serine/threonine-protein kinase
MYFQMYAELAGFVHDDALVLDALERAVDDGLIDRSWLESCPLFDAVCADPRYLAVQAEVKRRAEEILAAYRAG